MAPSRLSLPTQDELPCDDGVPMETQRHKLQMDILIDALFPWLAAREDGYVGGNMFVYFSAAQLKNEEFRGPDFFAVLGVPKAERKSWVVWQEGKAPDVVIELLSESTAQQDKTEKKAIYQDRLRVPEYFWYDPFNPEDWAGFILRDGNYEPLSLEMGERFFSQRLGLALVRWQGEYKGFAGDLLPTESELTEQERMRAEQERMRAEQERMRAEDLEALLQRYRERFGDLPE
ncbi:MAG: Uma2 family endonuclease [Microcystis aeruginosa L211-11]|nr:Uma2 family endonuclease [Microcystis aeruginosa L211-11]